MKMHMRIVAGLALLAGTMLLPGDAAAGRFGGGGGGRGGGERGGAQGGGGREGGGYEGGGNRGGGSPAARPQPQQQQSRPSGSGERQSSSSAVHGPYGGSSSGSRETASGTGARGGSGTASREQATYNGARGGTGTSTSRSGSYTGKGGTTASGASGSATYTGPHGAQAVGGAKGGTVTGPGGNTYAGGKAGAVVMGPNGNVHATGTQGAAVKTPSGTAATASHGSLTAGANGATASRSNAAYASGARGTAAASTHSAAAVGQYGAVAASSKSVTGVSAKTNNVYAGTRYTSANNLQGQGAYVRKGFTNYNSFTPSWNQSHPGAWAAAGYAAGSAWKPATWASAATYVGYPADASPVYFDYGNSVTYQDGNVYYGDQVQGSEAQYADQALAIADTGRAAQPAADEKWQALGVFAMVKGDETTSNDIFQLALNTDGVVRGNYYNAASDATTPVYGSLDKKSQRLAWSIGDKKDTVYETGLFNLTKEETTLLAHFGKDRTEQYNLIRVEQPEDGKAP